jgi:hypothetical protein
MTELDLYRFIEQNNVEWHKRDNDGEKDVVIFPYSFHMDDFIKLIKNYDSDEGLECRIMNGYFAIWMKDLCEYYGIDIERVFVGENYDD